MRPAYTLLQRAALLVLVATSAEAATITVTSSADSGAGSLRAAITTANASSGADVIEFDIAGNCPRVIQLASPLPVITADLSIEGYTQPGAAANTLDLGNDAAI